MLTYDTYTPIFYDLQVFSPTALSPSLLRGTNIHEFGLVKPFEHMLCTLRHHNHSKQLNLKHVGGERDKYK